MKFTTETELLDKDYCEQYDCKKLSKMIKIFISLIRCMLLELGDVNSIKITQSYDMKYSSYVPPSKSGIESFLINDYKTEMELKQCISMFTKAYNSLSAVEKESFYKIFMLNEKETFLQLDNYYKVPLQREITHIKKSMIIKFANHLKFHRIMDKVLGKKAN